MSSHTIGTYNMSFMSDLMTEIGPKMSFASEGAFLARLQGQPELRRSYWINAMNLLKEFLETEEPSVVGLQEMNFTGEGANTGTDAINMMLQGTSYKQISQNVPTNNAGLSIIFNPEKVGELKHVQCIDNKNQPGRPLLMLITELKGKNYLSVSMHGAQDPKLRLDKGAFNDYMVKNNKVFLEESIKEFLSSNGITNLNGVFIMGDFNDRYDAIKNITIGENDARYIGLAPKSCCHNWDSSCTDDDIEQDFGDGYKTCKEPAKMKNNIGSKLSLPGERGATKNYKYAGDKVFGFNPQTDMSIYRPDKFKRDQGVSTESDHEFVYATVGEENVAVGANMVRPNTVGPNTVGANTMNAGNRRTRRWRKKSKNGKSKRKYRIHRKFM